MPVWMSCGEEGWNRLQVGGAAYFAAYYAHTTYHITHAV